MSSNNLLESAKTSSEMTTTFQDLFKGWEEESQDHLKVLNLLLKQMECLHKKAEDSRKELKDFQKNCSKHEINKHECDRMKKLYDKVIDNDNKEVEATRLFLDFVQEIRSLARFRQHKTPYTSISKKSIRRGQMIKGLYDCANTLPLWIGRSPQEKPPQLCGAIPGHKDYNPQIGDLVCALIPSQNKDASQNPPNPQGCQNSPEKSIEWILASVIHANGNKFEIDDIDDEQNSFHSITRRSLVPLPLYRANPKTNPEALFKSDTSILALYPQTTCFYRGKVLCPPTHANGMYKILFHDGTYSDGYAPPFEVPQRFVIKVPYDYDIEVSEKKNQETDTLALKDLVLAPYSTKMSTLYRSIKRD